MDTTAFSGHSYRMPQYAIITENDESAWHDKTGELYHFPRRYLRYLQPGTPVIYYKGKQRHSRYTDTRLSDQPHYFAIATIGQSWPDSDSSKGDYYCQIINFQPFAQGVLAKQGSGYLETIPSSRVVNYWRDGVREIDEETYSRIRSLATLTTSASPTLDTHDNDQGTSPAFESGMEGQKSQKFVTTYERDPQLRRTAIALHDTSCLACGFNFRKVYGERGEGFIHIHHCRPVSELGQSTKVNPKTDLVPVCANCHAMIHRKKDSTLSIDELKAILKATAAGVQT